MNEQLFARFGEQFKPVRYDNRRSAAAVARLKVAGVPLEFAVEQLRRSCLLFNPSKHGRGNLPGTLGYFERGILKAFAVRGQTEITLLAVEPGGEELTRVVRSDAPRPNPAGPEKLSSAMEAFTEGDAPARGDVSDDMAISGPPNGGESRSLLLVRDSARMCCNARALLSQLGAVDASRRMRLSEVQKRSIGRSRKSRRVINQPAQRAGSQMIQEETGGYRSARQSARGRNGNANAPAAHCFECGKELIIACPSGVREGGVISGSRIRSKAPQPDRSIPSPRRAGNATSRWRSVPAGRGKGRPPTHCEAYENSGKAGGA